MTDTESFRSHIVTRLPIRVRWLIKGTPLDFDFSRSLAPLKFITANDIMGGAIDDEWKPLSIFGTNDYAAGGGASSYLCVHTKTGKIFGLDLERQESPMFLFNSDVDKFIQTFLILDQALRLGSFSPQKLPTRLKEVDPDALEYGEWRLLCEHVLK
jgi:hypothetical protein